MFADGVDREYILDILDWCRKQPQNVYKFRTRNPARIFEFEEMMPKQCMIISELESNRDYGLTKAPPPEDRYKAMLALTRSFVTAVDLKPLLPFDHDVLVEWIRSMDVQWCYFTALHKWVTWRPPMGEPELSEIAQLIFGVAMYTDVYIGPTFKYLLLRKAGIDE